VLSPTKNRILAVDDVADNLFLLQAVLEAEGYQVDTASDGDMALAKVQTSLPDLILLDVMMPRMNGYEVTQHIRQSDDLPFIPIILLTAHGEASIARGLKAGANDFIYKPIDFDELLERVAAFLSAKQESEIRPSAIYHREAKAYSQVRQ
jgi:CheY-like chemotaxis protein